MKAYSSDLRERVVAACRTGLTQPAVAAQFSVSLSFVAKLLHRQRTSGSVLARPPGAARPRAWTPRPWSNSRPACAKRPMPPSTSYAANWPPPTGRP